MPQQNYNKIAYFSIAIGIFLAILSSLREMNAQRPQLLSNFMLPLFLLAFGTLLRTNPNIFDSLFDRLAELTRPHITEQERQALFAQMDRFFLPQEIIEQRRNIFADFFNGQVHNGQSLRWAQNIITGADPQQKTAPAA